MTKGDGGSKISQKRWRPLCISPNHFVSPALIQNHFWGVGLEKTALTLHTGTKFGKQIAISIKVKYPSFYKTDLSGIFVIYWLLFSHQSCESKHKLNFFRREIFLNFGDAIYYRDREYSMPCGVRFWWLNCTNIKNVCMSSNIFMLMLVKQFCLSIYLFFFNIAVYRGGLCIPN